MQGSKKIRIILTRKNFERCYLHYDIEHNEYYIFANTRKYNHRLKEIIKKAKRQIYKEQNISLDDGLRFEPIGYERFLRHHETV